MSDKKMNALKEAQEVFALYMQGKVTISEVNRAWEDYIYA